MTDNEVFASAIRILDDGDGPTEVYDPSDHWSSALIGISQKRAEHFRQVHAIRPVPSISVGYVSKPYLNAVAFNFVNKSEEHLIVAVNGGTSIVLEDMFSRLLSEPDVFPQIGDPTQEVSGTAFAIPIDANELADHYLGDSPQQIRRSPKDDRRQRAVTFLSFLAMEFLFEHELRHLLAGHVPYLQSLGCSRLIQEAYSEKLSQDEGLLSQALEYDADQAGAIYVLSLANNVLTNKNPLAVDLVETPDDALFYSQTAIYCLWRLFGDRLPTTDWKRLSHPPALIRHHLIEQTFRTIYEGFFGENASERHSEQYGRSVTEANWGFTKIQGQYWEPDFAKTGGADVLRENSIEHMRLIMATWEGLKGELQPFKFCEM